MAHYCKGSVGPASQHTDPFLADAGCLGFVLVFQELYIVL